MADTVTPNYNLIKPQIGASADTWGIKLNQNMDAIDTAMAKALNEDGTNDHTGNQQVFANTGIKIGTFGLAIEAGDLVIRVSGVVKARLEADGTFTATDVVGDPAIS
jgi:hypothetical protein